jgi:hypothetical protein
MSGYAGDGGLAIDATLKGPIAVSVDSNGNMQVVTAIMIPGTIGSYRVSVQVPDAGQLNPDVNGFFLGTISFEPGDPLVGKFQTQFGAVPIRP